MEMPYFWLASLTLCLLVRTGRRAVDRARHRQSRRALIVGTGRLARRAHGHLRDRLHRYEVVGFVDDPTGDVRRSRSAGDDRDARSSSRS